MNLKYKGYFFDFDYTLADSGDAVAMCFQHILKLEGFNDITDDAIKATIGNPWKKEIEILTGIVDEEKLAKMRAEYVKFGDTCMTKNTRIYEGTIPVLKAIHESGAKVFIVTNKDGRRLKEGIEYFNLTPYVDGVVSGDMVAYPKPSPDGLLRAVEMSGLDIADCVYVGDSYIDAQTSENAGMDFLAVTTGSTTKEDFAEYSPIAILDDIALIKDGLNCIGKSDIPAEEMLELARKTRENAYSPYSNFKVGAALLASDGRIFTGCNVENASYGATICAERTAVTKAVSEGSTSYKAIAIVSSTNDKTYPCGVCRQVLAEFMDKSEAFLILESNGEAIIEDFWRLIPENFVL